MLHVDPTNPQQSISDFDQISPEFSFIDIATDLHTYSAASAFY